MRAAILGLLGLLTFATGLAQLPSFEVASVKRHVAIDPNSSVQFTPDGGFRAINVSLIVLAATAYSDATFALRTSQIVAAPSWIQSERYDISANAPANADDRTYIGVRARLR